MKGLKKRGVIWDTLIPWMIAIFVIVVTFILFATISGKGQGALEFFKNLWRFGR